MEILNDIRLVAGVVFLIAGILFFVIQIAGILRYKFVLNRMHAAGMGDTFALLLCCIGLMLLSGFNLTTAKIALVFILLWFTSPTSSHLIAGMEVLTDDTVEKHADIRMEDVKQYVDGHIERGLDADQKEDEA